jgi:hypothetical protein
MLLLPILAPIHLLWAVAALFLSAGLLVLSGRPAALASPL